MRSRRLALLAIEILVPVIVILLIAIWAGYKDSFHVPSFGRIWAAFKERWLWDGIAEHVLPSLYRFGMGYALAVIGGVTAGILLSTYWPLRATFGPIVEFLRAMPAPALVPMFIVLLGIGDTAKIALIALVSTFPILLNTIDGITGIDPLLRDVSRSYQISRRDWLLRVALPAASPRIFAGMRTSLALALILMVVSEMVGSFNGIGYSILRAQSMFDIPSMWAGMLLLGCIGYILNAAFAAIESRALRWHRGMNRIDNP